MIKVVYDYQIFLAQQYGGISRYFVELARRVDSMPDFDATILAPLYRNQFVDRKRDKVVGMKVPVIPRTARLMGLFSASVSAAAWSASPPDVVHETYFRKRSIAPRRVPLVVTVYDMIREKYPHLYPKGDDVAERKRSALLRATRVICISESTRRDVIDIVGVAPEKAVTVHLGVDRLGNLGSRKVTSPAGRPFLLYLGDRFGHKNFLDFLAAYANSRRLRQSCCVVAFGGGHFSDWEAERMRQLGLVAGRDVVRVSGNDDLLTQYYLGALALVYPSLYEGFGLPLLEAMRVGCPVACSNTSAIPEVVGDAAAFFDPLQIDSIRDVIEEVVDSESLRETLVHRGNKRVQQFTWERCANKTAKLYRELASR